jgi:NUC153 domain-containing protein
MPRLLIDRSRLVGSGKTAPALALCHILSNPRCLALFEDRGFEIDEESREFALLIPSAAIQKGRVPETEGEWCVHGKTAAKSDKVSLNDMSSSSSGESSGSEGVNERWAESEDSNEAGGCLCFYYAYSPRTLINGTHPPYHRKPANLRPVPFHSGPQPLLAIL